MLHQKDNYQSNRLPQKPYNDVIKNLSVHIKSENFKFGFPDPKNPQNCYHTTIYDDKGVFCASFCHYFVTI